jgi:hypothetical protein
MSEEITNSLEEGARTFERFLTDYRSHYITELSLNKYCIKVVVTSGLVNTPSEKGGD